MFRIRAVIQLTWNAGASWSDALNSSGDEQNGEILTKRKNCNKNKAVIDRRLRPRFRPPGKLL